MTTDVIGIRIDEQTSELVGKLIEYKLVILLPFSFYPLKAVAAVSIP